MDVFVLYGFCIRVYDGVLCLYTGTPAVSCVNRSQLGHTIIPGLNLCCWPVFGINVTVNHILIALLSQTHDSGLSRIVYIALNLQSLYLK